MSWKNILKAGQWASMGETLVTIDNIIEEAEMQQQGLAESCCGQAKLDFFAAYGELHESHLDTEIERVTPLVNAKPEGPKKQKMQQLLQQILDYKKSISDIVSGYQTKIDMISCEEFRKFLQEEARDSNSVVHKMAKTILKDWKKCEGE